MATAPTVHLRPHHLLCLLTYVGRGYSPAFVANLDRVAARVAAGAAIRLVDGPDDICAPLVAAGRRQPVHCRFRRVVRRDCRAARAVSRLLGRPVAPGCLLRLDGPVVRRLRRAFAARAIRSACLGCPWARLCSTVAATGFRGSRLDPGTMASG